MLRVPYSSFFLVWSAKFSLFFFALPFDATPDKWRAYTYLALNDRMHACLPPGLVLVDTSGKLGQI